MYASSVYADFFHLGSLLCQAPHCFARDPQTCCNSSAFHEIVLWYARQSSYVLFSLKDPTPSSVFEMIFFVFLVAEPMSHLFGLVSLMWLHTLMTGIAAFSYLFTSYVTQKFIAGCPHFHHRHSRFRQLLNVPAFMFPINLCIQILLFIVLIGLVFGAAKDQCHSSPHPTNQRAIESCLKWMFYCMEERSTPGPHLRCLSSSTFSAFPTENCWETESEDNRLCRFPIAAGSPKTILAPEGNDRIHKKCTYEGLCTGPDSIVPNCNVCTFLRRKKFENEGVFASDFRSFHGHSRTHSPYFPKSHGSVLSNLPDEYYADETPSAGDRMMLELARALVRPHNSGRSLKTPRDSESPLKTPQNSERALNIPRDSESDTSTVKHSKMYPTKDSGKVRLHIICESGEMESTSLSLADISTPVGHQVMKEAREKKCTIRKSRDPKAPDDASRLAAFESAPIPFYTKDVWGRVRMELNRASGVHFTRDKSLNLAFFGSITEVIFRIKAPPRFSRTVVIHIVFSFALYVVVILRGKKQFIRPPFVQATHTECSLP
eukprot:Gregarina_sp_Poly_1__4718@NODE_251_length_10668_cov_46_370814_g33_i1_p2_GENE_NODE_251_length_10668_cov_46_370814_g33_i1NODE_251_length_10668_cov_46_370814_g33_i1_p2_ORF_typecomplete_len546_score55_66Claudin_3/PF06653_11/0_017Claudin_3/PF06653_11/5_3e03_NODE_251_length_10668_cov_46_370814_g33_i113793016